MLLRNWVCLSMNAVQSTSALHSTADSPQTEAIHTCLCFGGSCCLSETEALSTGDDRGCDSVCVVCVCKGLLKSTEVRSYSSKDGNIDILFNHLFLCLLPFKQLGPLIHGQEQRGHWYLGLIFEQRFIVMAECWAWEGGETENATHTLEDVCMCVKCMCW